LKSGISGNRIAQLIDEHGINFDFNDAAAKQLIQDNTNEAVQAAIKRASDRYKKDQQERLRLVEEAKRKAQEQEKLLDDERKRAETEKLRLAELETRKQEQSRQREDALRKEEEKLRQAEMERHRREDEARQKAEEKGRAQTTKLEVDQKLTEAISPPCTVGLRHQFQYTDGDRFTRTVSKREGEVCVVGRFYFDKDWKLIKEFDRDGNELTVKNMESNYRVLDNRGRADQPLLGEKWMPFPLSVGKHWESNYRSLVRRARSFSNFDSHFTVMDYEKVTVSAGSFMAFKIRQETRSGSADRGVRHFWYAPEVEYYVKVQHAHEESRPPNYWPNARDYELISVSRPRP
jgi:hypothetical protein